jgi:hypothetical protein
MQSQTRGGEKFPPSKMPVAGIVLTLLGALAYFPWTFGFFVGSAIVGEVPYQFTAFFISTIGVLGCVVMMGVRPKLHVAWGVLVLLFSLLAIVIDENILVNFFNGSGLTGIFWGAPLILVMIGGILAIIWKPPVDPNILGSKENRSA